MAPDDGTTPSASVILREVSEKVSYPNSKQTGQSQPVVRRDVEGTSKGAGRNRPRHRNQGCYPCGERLGFLGGSRSQRSACHSR